MATARRAHVRSRARSWALNLLYGWEICGSGTPAEKLQQLLEHRNMSRRYRPHVERLFEEVSRHLREIDSIIERHATNWRLDRLNAIDRNILRIGIAELRWIDEVPPKVAIHEALKLAKLYGADDSRSFVNGVMDAVHKERPGGAAGGA